MLARSPEHASRLIRSRVELEGLIDELTERYTIAIFTHNLQQVARAANATAFILGGELVEHRSTTRKFTDPKDERTGREVTGKFG